jgi:hypothetical protein
LLYGLVFFTHVFVRLVLAHHVLVHAVTERRDILRPVERWRLQATANGKQRPGESKQQQQQQSSEARCQQQSRRRRRSNRNKQQKKQEQRQQYKIKLPP